MREPKLIETCEVALAEIDTLNRLRPVSELAVTSLIASIETTGLQAEILLRKARKKGLPYRLIAGGHRLAAFEEMGRELIPAKIYDCTDDAARLMEIDDNLANSQLTPLDLSLFLAERKRVYEKAFPQKVKGKAGAVARWDATALNAVASFAATAAESLGLKERQLYKLTAIGSRLTTAEIDQLRSAERPVFVADLEALSKLGDPEARQRACEAVATGTAKTVRDAIRQQSGVKHAKISNRAAQSEKIVDAWRRASKGARRAFVAEHAEEIAEILADLPADPEIVPFKTKRWEQ